MAPTHVMPIIRPAGNGRELVGQGLVPFWLKPDQLAKQPYSTINARAETIRTAPTYREPFKTKRCLVPATGCYEWQKLDARKKRPIHMCPKATPFALAGVYDVWKGDGGKAITSFAIITTDAVGVGVRRINCSASRSSAAAWASFEPGWKSWANTEWAFMGSSFA
jgi:putative SOS response-associated peptidase YedK